MRDPKLLLKAIEDKHQIQLEAGSFWRKFLWVLLGLLMIIFGVGIWCLVRWKRPSQSYKEINEVLQDKIMLVDLQAKIQKAKAIEAEKVVIEKLENIKEIKDRRERLDQYAKLMSY